MILFHNDYSEGCHPAVLDHLIRTNMEQTPGYSEDCYTPKETRVGTTDLERVTNAMHAELADRGSTL